MKTYATVFLLSMATAATLSTSVRAQSNGEEEARALFLAGREAFEDGRFDEALQYFSRSLELSGRELLAHNIAACHDRLGHAEEAVTWYERYLEHFPEAERRSFIESRIRILQANVDASRAGDAETPGQGGTAQIDLANTDPATADTSAGGPPVPALILFGTAGAAGVAGIITGVVSLSQRSDLEEQCPGLVCDEMHRSDVDSLSQTALIADVLLGVSLAAAIGGVAAVLLDDSDSEDSESAVSVTPTLSPATAGLMLQTRL